MGIAPRVRAALKYVTDEDSRPVASDRRPVYQAANAAEAGAAPGRFAGKWDGKYPTISKPGRPRWSDVVAMFEFPPATRKAIATADAIESVNGGIRKFTRNREQYPNADSAVKRIDLAIAEASKKGAMPIVGWKRALNPFGLLFEGRMPPKLNDGRATLAQDAPVTTFPTGPLRYHASRTLSGTVSGTPVSASHEYHRLKFSRGTRCLSIAALRPGTLHDLV